MEKIEKLTRREEELMRCFWQRGALFVRELVEMAGEPKPHFNTLSTMVRTLEAKGYLSHESFGSTYRYYPLVSEEQFSRRTLGNVIRWAWTRLPPCATGARRSPSPRWPPG